ncbi:MAG: hypothetical protein DRJ47_09445 [Thermoprotei archaeon]|nr:MAG: hypothetical protein DRJ47_09445 [Thermoprotei archaeon]
MKGSYKVFLLFALFCLIPLISVGKPVDTKYDSYNNPYFYSWAEVKAIADPFGYGHARAERSYGGYTEPISPLRLDYEFYYVDSSGMIVDYEKDYRVTSGYYTEVWCSSSINHMVSIVKAKASSQFRDNALPDPPANEFTLITAWAVAQDDWLGGDGS